MVVVKVVVEVVVVGVVGVVVVVAAAAVVVLVVAAAAAAAEQRFGTTVLKLTVQEHARRGRCERRLALDLECLRLLLQSATCSAKH